MSVGNGVAVGGVLVRRKVNVGLGVGVKTWITGRVVAAGVVRSAVAGVGVGSGVAVSAAASVGPAVVSGVAGGGVTRKAGSSGAAPPQPNDKIGRRAEEKITTARQTRIFFSRRAEWAPAGRRFPAGRRIFDGQERIIQ